MENQPELLTALELLQNPTAFSRALQIKVESNLVVPTVSDDDLRDFAPEILTSLVASAADTNQTFARIYDETLVRHKEPDRSVTDWLPYFEQAYHLVKDHWGEVFFILHYLDKGGHLDKLKKRKSLKTFFETLFDNDKK